MVVINRVWSIQLVSVSISIDCYIIRSVMHAFWLVLTYDLLEERHIDDVLIKTFFPSIFNSLLHKTNRFQVAVHLFSNRSQRTSKRGKNICDTLSCALCATFLFLPHFDIICDLLLNRRTATWKLFVKWHFNMKDYNVVYFELQSHHVRVLIILGFKIKTNYWINTMLNMNKGKNCEGPLRIRGINM